MSVLGSNIAIGVYVLDMWSVLVIIYVGGGMKYSDMSVYVGHMVSAVCSLCGWWDLI